jgi:hyaluronan synthase
MTIYKISLTLTRSLFIFFVMLSFTSLNFIVFTDFSFSLIGLYLIFLYLILKLLISTYYSPFQYPLKKFSIRAVVPFYNENVYTFKKCVNSILNQSYPISEIYFIDDGSTNKECYNFVYDLIKKYPHIKLIEHHDNQGKRKALAQGIENSSTDMILTVDSDTVLDYHFAEEALKSFHFDNIVGVSGNIEALNFDENFLTYLINSRYKNAFLLDRSFMSFLGNITCVMGMASMWRTDILKKILPKFLDQRFLLVSVQSGDDRRLTALALRHGQVVFQSTAKAHTIVPNTLIKSLKQQLRWSRNFFVESLSEVFKINIFRISFYINFFELLNSLMFAPLLIYNFITYQKSFISIILLFVIFNACFSFYTLKKRHLNHLIIPIFVMPFLIILQNIILYPYRIFSILSLLKPNKWLTR